MNLCKQCNKNETCWASYCQECKKGICEECRGEFDNLLKKIHNEHYETCKVCKFGFDNFCNKCKNNITKMMKEDNYIGDPDKYIEQELLSHMCNCEWYDLGYDVFKCIDESAEKARKEFNVNIPIYVTDSCGYEASYCKECFILNKEYEPSEDCRKF